MNSQIQTITFTTMIPTVTTGNVRVGTLSFSGSMPRESYRITRAINAFWACRRFSAWSQTADCGP